MKKLKEEVENKGLILSVTENGKEGQRSRTAACWRTSCVNVARKKEW